jgi:hypothetical protein
MKAGDHVVYLADPTLYGVGTIERTLPGGRIVVRFEDVDGEEQFAPEELELAEVWAKGAAA